MATKKPWPTDDWSPWTTWTWLKKGARQPRGNEERTTRTTSSNGRSNNFVRGNPSARFHLRPFLKNDDELRSVLQAAAGSSNLGYERLDKSLLQGKQKPSLFHSKNPPFLCSDKKEGTHTRYSRETVRRFAMEHLAAVLYGTAGARDDESFFLRSTFSISHSRQKKNNSCLPVWLPRLVKKRQQTSGPPYNPNFDETVVRPISALRFLLLLPFTFLL